jgi:hypothetical protein
MGIRRVVWGLLFAAALCVATTTFADVISGSGGASFQSWVPADLNESGTPYWDNSSLDGYQRNAGYYLINAPTAPLDGAPGALMFWGLAGGNADLSFYFQRTASSSDVNLKLEIAGNSNINEFGWYDITDPSVQHPLFLGPDSAPATNTFSPSEQYGFYLKAPGEGTFYTQSSLNSDPSDRTHQHFVIFQESATPEAEIYWIGIEDLSISALGGREGCVGDYNDMLLRLSVLSPSNTIPEPSTAALVFAGAMLMMALNRRRR